MKNHLPAPQKPFNLKNIAFLSALIIIFIAVFRVLKMYNLFAVAVILYTVIGLSAAVYYIIYNRGVLSGDITPEMLSPTLTAEQKQAMIQDIADRRKKSKWVFLILIPTLTVFAFEMLERYFFPMLFSLFTGA